MKLRICSEGVCFLKAFRFTAADLKRGLCFSGSICRSARGEPAALASAGTLHTELFLRPVSEAVSGNGYGGKAVLCFCGPSDFAEGQAEARNEFLSLVADKQASFPCLQRWSAVMQASTYQHSDLSSARTEPDFTC